MKSIFLSIFAFFSVFNNAGAQGRGELVPEYLYKTYRYQPFRHLEFDILDKWNPVQNNLEVVFTDEGENLPQLFFQAVGKTEEFKNSSDFLNFLKKNDPSQQFQNISSTKVSEYEALTFGYLDQGFPSIYNYALIVDVGEGILWFYLKVPQEEAGQSHPIIKQLIASIDFK